MGQPPIYWIVNSERPSILLTCLHLLQGPQSCIPCSWPNFFLLCPLCQLLTLASWDHWPWEWGSHTQSFRPYFQENPPVKTVMWFFPLNHVWSRSAGEITKLQSELLMRTLGEHVKPDSPPKALRLNWTVIVSVAFSGTPRNWAIT